MKKRAFWIFLLFISSSFLISSHAETLYLVPRDTSYIISSPYFTEWEDPTAHLSFQEVLRHRNEFHPSQAQHFSNPRIPSAYWFKINLKNQSHFESFCLVSHNYGLKEIDVYWVDEKERVYQSHYDRNISVFDRNVVHRQPVFNVPIPEGSAMELFVRVKNGYSSEFAFELYQLNTFISHYTIEYILFGIFYGMLIFVVLYNSTLYFSLRQGYLLALVVFNIVQIITMAFRDGNSVFLFLRLTDLTFWIESLFIRMFFITLTIFCILFLNLKTNKRFVTFLLVINILNLVLSQLNLDYKDFFSYHIDLLILGSCMYSALYQWIKGEPLAKFVFGGLLSLFVTYFIYYLSIFNIVNVYYFSFFSLYFGVIAESIFFTFASSEKIKMIQIGHIQMEELNKELETKVAERTKIIQEQNAMLEQKADEINQFLYKSSHDLKGPIKSIEGLCLVAKLETPDKHADYIQRIQDRTKVLSGIITDLNQVIIANNAPISRTHIDFEVMHREICELFEAFPGFTHTHISLNIINNTPFYSDRRLIFSVYQNLFENSIKYRNPNKSSFLNISIDSSENQCVWVFQDNGIGIPQIFLDKVFDMFFRANDTFQDSNGLGLYLVKVSVEKLDGT
ncbi:MAG: sensor histidine kinase, partial [Cytophagales bacterium]|nr:sensor histidine kinase [Cytophagales bacterium]